jgi:micrococcal nuclease
VRGRPQPRVVAANRRRSARRARAGGAQLRHALIWGAVTAGLAGGFAVLAPLVEDLRSDMREMRTDCSVVRVIDGDTLDLSCPGRGTERARITGFDAPELYSAACSAERQAAEQARRVLESWVRNAYPLEVAFTGRDKYDRALVDMRLGGSRVAAAMVEAGHGRRYFGSLRGGWC